MVMLLSDQYDDVRELLSAWPMAPYEIAAASLKSTEPRDLIATHPDVLLLDGTGDVEAAEDASRRLSLAWETSLPPIIIVVNDETVGRFRFEIGADDFLLQEAQQGEISARLSFALRRSGRAEDAGVIKVGELTVNPDNYQTYVRGRPLDLTYKEFELLKFLAQRPGRVCGRDLLLREVWGYDYYGGTRTVDVHIRRLRAKLGGDHEALIETIRNVGYRLVPRPRDRV
ncbi:MAG: response regulator transcription factor [Actinobacteria bacterium]|nr:response regulator transcription factor [Actinomycetota bacterium]